MTKRHKYADVIVAWAEGKAVQCKQAGIDGAWDKWQDWSNDAEESPDFNAAGWLWRIKPEHEWDENTTITLKLPTPEHAMVLYALFCASHNEKLELTKRAFDLLQQAVQLLDESLERRSVSNNLYQQVKHLKQPVLEAYKEKHNL